MKVAVVNTRPGVHNRYLHRLLSGGNARRIFCNRRHLLAGVCAGCGKRFAATEASTLCSRSSDFGRSRGRLIGPDGCSGVATGTSRHCRLANLDYFGRKLSLSLAVPHQFSLDNCWRCVLWVDSALMLASFSRSTIPLGTFLELLCFGGNQFQSVGMGVTGQERGLLEAEGGTSL